MCVNNNDNISKGSSPYGVGDDIIIHFALMRYIKEVRIKEKFNKLLVLNEARFYIKRKCICLERNLFITDDALAYLYDIL